MVKHVNSDKNRSLILVYTIWISLQIAEINMVINMYYKPRGKGQFKLKSVFYAFYSIWSGSTLFAYVCLPQSIKNKETKKKNTQKQTQTSKFHREFMSPALFLFELLKMGKLTRGPLVLYHLPKYWSRKLMIKNNVRILKKKTLAYLQTILKAPVKFQMDRLKTVVGVTGTRYLLPIRFCSIRTQKMSKLKTRKKW